MKPTEQPMTPSPIKPTFVELMEKATPGPYRLSAPDAYRCEIYGQNAHMEATPFLRGNPIYDSQRNWAELTVRLLTWARAGGYEALDACIEYAGENLSHHDAALGRTTSKNKHYGDRMEADIATARNLIAILDGKTNEEKL